MNRLEKIGVCTLAVGVFLGISIVPGHAKDVCVQDQFNVLYVFKKVKPLKKPGAMTPLHGATLFGGVVSVLSGTAYVRADSTVEFGIFVHSSPPAVAMVPRNLTMTLEGDADYNASGASDLDGNHQNDGVITWTPVDCATVILP